MIITPICRRDSAWSSGARSRSLRRVHLSGIALAPGHLCLLGNIVNTTKEVELVQNAEPGAGRRERRNGQPEEPALDDDRLLDHHIEEVLDTLRAWVREDADTHEQRHRSGAAEGP